MYAYTCLPVDSIIIMIVEKKEGKKRKNSLIKYNPLQGDSKFLIKPTLHVLQMTFPQTKLAKNKTLASTTQLCCCPHPRGNICARVLDS